MLADTDWNPLILAVAAILPTGISIISIYVVWLTRQDVAKIEVATNSMKDALVKATRDEALLRGASNEKTRADAETATKAIGAMDERTRAEQQEAPTLIVEEGKVVANDPERTPIVVDMKSKPGIIADEKKD